MLKVEIYGIPDCLFTRKALDFFETRRIPVLWHDVTRDAAKAEEMMARVKRYGVPVIVVNDEVFIGFDPEEIENILGGAAT